MLNLFQHLVNAELLLVNLFQHLMNAELLFFIAAKIAANIFVKIIYIVDIYGLYFFYFGINTLY